MKTPPRGLLIFSPRLLSRFLTRVWPITHVGEMHDALDCLVRPKQFLNQETWADTRSGPTHAIAQYCVLHLSRIQPPPNTSLSCSNQTHGTSHNVQVYQPRG